MIEALITQSYLNILNSMDRKCPFPHKVEKWAHKNHTTGWKVKNEILETKNNPRRSKTSTTWKSWWWSTQTSKLAGFGKILYRIHACVKID